MHEDRTEIDLCELIMLIRKK